MPKNRDRYPIKGAGQALLSCGDMAPPKVLTGNRTYVIIQLQSNFVEAWNIAERYRCAKCPFWTLGLSVTAGGKRYGCWAGSVCPTPLTVTKRRRSSPTRRFSNATHTADSQQVHKRNAEELCVMFVYLLFVFLLVPLTYSKGKVAHETTE